MKQNIKTLCAVTGIVMAAVASQPAMADGGWGRHHGGHGHSRGWVPFALGAVVGGIAIGAMMSPPVPVVAQPVYPVPPPGYYGRPRMMPQPIYVVPAPAPQVYYTY